jgi:DNA mismatch repair ATPase MutS
MLLEQINEKQTIFYLLDEILKGTNSADRHIGAESLILQLNKMNVFGLVSTHDLELGKLGDQNEWISNYNFNSTIEGEEIIFDYKLQPGICQSTNASQLMAKIGIQIKP